MEKALPSGSRKANIGGTPGQVRISSVSTHELVEAITDNLATPGNNPNFPQAWNDSMGNELGDLCGASGTVMTGLGTFTVQTIWDERTKACKVFSSEANDFNAFFFQNLARLTYWMDKPDQFAPFSKMADTSLAVRVAAWAIVPRTTGADSPSVENIAQGACAGGKVTRGQ